MTDRRFVPVHAALAAGQIRVLSVDIFDTLMWRRVPEPKDVFLILGAKLAEKRQLAPHVNPVTFAELRAAAEKDARARKEAATGSREITLVDVYRELPPFLFAKGFDAPAAAAAEVTFEDSLMIRDAAVAELMTAAKKAGAKVILVSDTYFSSAQIKGFLAKPGLVEGRDFDRLYVSCEAGRPKWRDLFDTVIADMGVPPGEILHVGDTLEADVWPCRLRGIAVCHYDKWAFDSRVQSLEWPSALGVRAARLGPGGDFGLTGLRSRIFHRVPADLSPSLAPYWAYGAAKLAPVFAGFARWVVSGCKTIGAGKVFGLMREGRFLNRVVGETAKALGVPLATEELWLSRRAVIRAALAPETTGLLPEFAMLTPGHDTASVLKEMGLTVADVAGLVGGAFDFTEDRALVRLCQALGTAPHLIAKVMAVAARHRTLLLTALEKQMDLRSAGPVVMMDLGYSATIQSVLQGLLAREGSPLHLTGFYVALNAKAQANVGEGADLRGYLDADGFAGPMGKLLSRVPFVLEHACMCPEGSLSHFDEKGEPVLLPNLRDETQIAQMEATQAGILAGVAAINEMLGDLATTPADAPALKAQIVAILESSHLHPTAQEAATIGAWKHEAKIDFTGAHKLTDLSFDGPLLEYRGWPGLQEINLDQVYWPAAAFVAADPFIADVYAAGTKDAYKAANLTAGPLLGRVTVCPDAGAGFDERRQGTIPIAANTFGRAELVATIKGVGPEAYQRLRITWPGARSVVNLDTMTVTYTSETDRRTQAVDLRGASWSNVRDLGNGLVETGPGAQCVIALPAAPPAPHGLEMSLRLKFLRLDPLFGAKP